MAHKRIRTDTTIVVYKYGASPLNELSTEFWLLPKNTKEIWNEFVQMRDDLSAKFEALGINGQEQSKERIPYWQEFDKEWRDYLRKHAG